MTAIRDCSHRPAPPPVPANKKDRERQRFLNDMGRRLQHRCRNTATLVLTGGGAISLRPDATRVTGDLDLDTDRPIPGLDLVREAAERSEWRGRLEIDRKQRGRGYIRVRTIGRSGSEQGWDTKVDIRVAGQGGRPPIPHRETLVYQTAEGPIRTYSLAELARLKRAKLERREEGRDLYDNGWLLARHPEVYPQQARIDLCRTLIAHLDDEPRALARLRADRVVHNADPEAVYLTLLECALNDPGLIAAQMDRPRLIVQDADPQSEARALLLERNANAVIVARKPTPEDLSEELVRYALRDPEEHRTKMQTWNTRREEERAPWLRPHFEGLDRRLRELERERPVGGVHLGVHMGGQVELQYRTDEIEEAVHLHTFAHPLEACAFLTWTGRRELKDTPVLERTLERERERARAFARNRSR